MGLWRTLTRPGLLARLSRGRPKRAALILVGVFLAPVPVCTAIWFIGLAPIFDHSRWIPITAVIAFGLGAYLSLMLKFGFWGVGVHSGRDGGDQFVDDFTPGVAFGLGWLRWFVQIVGVGASALVVGAVLANMRWFHLFSTPAIDSLPDRVASMPIPDDWTLTDTDTGDDGDNFHPNGYYERRFDVPASVDFEQLTSWLAGPAWADDPDGESFGAIEALRCSTENTRCLAQLEPPDGQEPEYFVGAWFTPGSQYEDPEVRLRLTYEEYHAPDYNVSEETLDRAALLPIPADWVRYNAWGETTINGEDFTQFFVVPETFSGDDLQSWVTGSVWTAPESGPAFGEIRLTGPCDGPEPSDPSLCSAIVVATERDASGRGDGPIESFRASLDADHTVRITFSRNG